MQTVLANRALGVAKQARAAPRSGAKAARAPVSVRAEGGESTPPPPPAAPAKKDRSGDQLIFASEQSLSYLDGTLPADYGFDPLGLSDPEGAGAFVNPKWLAYSEVIHGRWAMLGAAGCIAPEILASAGSIPQSPAEVLWFKSGVIPPAGTYARGYWADPFALFWLEVVAMQFAELKRWQDYRHPGSQGKQYFLGMENAFNGSGDPAYPGGPWFNMFNLGKTDAEMKVLKTKELKNGRLAMLAVFGYGAQAILTGEGPWQNLKDHLSNPAGNNLVTNLGKIGGVTL